MAEVEKLIEIYNRLENAGLMVIAGKKDSAELMVSNDVVPVVRCKDCKFWEEFESSLIGKVMCCTGQGSARIQKSADDFCSFGERKAP